MQKKLHTLSIEDLHSCPVWRYEGKDDRNAVVVAVEGFSDIDQTAHIALTRFTLADGTTFHGYCSPCEDSGIDYIQPVIITHVGDHVRFWYDEPPAFDATGRAMKLLGKDARSVFPIRYECLVECEGRQLAGMIQSVVYP